VCVVQLFDEARAAELRAVDLKYNTLEEALHVELDYKVNLLNVQLDNTRIVYDYAVMLRESSAANHVCEVVKSLANEDIDPFKFMLDMPAPSSNYNAALNAWNFDEENEK